MIKWPTYDPQLGSRGHREAGDTRRLVTLGGWEAGDAGRLGGGGHWEAGIVGRVGSGGHWGGGTMRTARRGEEGDTRAAGKQRA